MPISTPHLVPIPFILADGKKIVIEGTIAHDAKRVTFSLCRENDLNHDTPLTFDIRLNDSVAVRNHFRGNWGPEDRHGGFPFRRGEHYKVKIVGTHDSYQVFVNKEHFCDFKHRMEKEAARNLFIQGEFAIDKVYFPGFDHPEGGGYPSSQSYPAGGGYPSSQSYPAGGAYPSAQSYPGGGYNPSATPMTTPHLAPIPFPLSEGKEIIVEGTIDHDAKRVTISLCKESDLKHDTPITFDIRFPDAVVRNHFRGNWGPEDRHGGFPFRKGENCKVKFLVKNEGYQIFVNEQHFCDFNHRIEKEAARNLFIEGNFKISKISFPGSGYPAGGANPQASHYPSGGANPPAPSYQQGGGYPPAPSYQGSGGYPSSQSYPPSQGYPSTYEGGPFVNPSSQNQTAYPSGGGYPPATSYPGSGGYPPAQSYPTDQGYSSGFGGGPISNPPVPFSAPIPGGLYPGKIIYVSGVPNNSPARFSINLATGNHDSADYALAFDVRFNYGGCYNVVVRNHKQNGSYGPEEKEQNNFPFSPGANFEIMILTEPNSFKIAVNNQHYTEFHHRIQPVQRVDCIKVNGDVRLTQVRFQ